MSNSQANQISSKLTTTLIVTTVVLAGSLAYKTQHVQAATPGYNGKIVFVSTRNGNDEIYTMNADGSNQTRLTNNSFTDKDPAWSPDGSKIAFRSNRDGNDEVYVMNADGTNQTRLTNNTSSDGGPSWSPDGQSIAFFSNRDGNNEIYRMNANGTNQVRLTNDPGSDLGARWLPDGSRIVFQSARTSSTQLFSMKADGSDLTQITHYSYSATVPDISPDGTKIIYTDNGIAFNTEIFRINLDGSSPVDLSNNADNDTAPSYSPHGDKIVFYRTTASVNYIYTMNADGTNQTVLTTSTADGRAPAWQPIPNQAPVVANDTLTTTTNTAASADVLANDTDEEALSASNLTIKTPPSHGTATITNGKISYTPNQDYVGSDSLTYQICDSFTLGQECATAVLGISITAAPASPTPTIPAPTINSIGTIQLNGADKVYFTGHRPTFSGTAEPGATITVTIHSDPIVLTTTADASGNWSVTPTQDIPNGDHQVIITASKDGATSQPFNLVLGINTGLAETGMPLWPISLLGLVGATSTRYVLKKRYSKLKI